MNNYLSLNLVNGKLGRVAGGGKPKFILDEQNEVQLYVLDYPKPTTYPPDSLADAYAYEIIPRNFDSSNVTLKAGVRGSNAIISTNSFFNLPTNLVLNTNSSAQIYGSQTAFFRCNFSYSSIPISGSLFSFTITVQYNSTSFTITSRSFSLENTLSQIDKIITESLGIAAVNAIGIIAINSPLPVPVSNLIQTSDYSYDYSATLTTNGLSGALSLSLTLNNVSASSNPGKYGYLDFSSSSWDSVIGTKVETPIWMEAMIGSNTIAQGNAIICRKMT